MNRRSLLTALPAVAAVPAVVLSGTASPFSALYARWLAARDAYNAGDQGDDGDAILYQRMWDIEEELLALRPETISDYAYKVLILDQFVDLEGCEIGAAFMAEARALIGGVA